MVEAVEVINYPRLVNSYGGLMVCVIWLHASSYKIFSFCSSFTSQSMSSILLA